MNISRLLSPPPSDAPFAEQLLIHREIDSAGCWLWTGNRDAGGYGIAYLWWQRWCCRTSAHRAAYLIWKGKIPDGRHVHHQCGVRACFNPEHLALVTPAEHSRAHPAPPRPLRSHCKWGHAFTTENTRRDVKGARVCVTCDRARRRACDEKRRANRPPKPAVQPVGQSLKTHCKYGHEFTEANTYTWTTPTGVQRLCRECRKQYQQRLRARDGLRPL